MSADPSFIRLNNMEFDVGSTRFRLTLALWDPAGHHWVPLPVRPFEGGCSGDNSLGHAVLTFTPCDLGWDYSLELSAPRPTRARIQLETMSSRPVYHLMPGVSHGDNSLAYDVEGRYPHLSRSESGPHTSPSWEFRADRCTHPVSLMLLDGVIAGVSIQPYSDDARGPGLGRGVCNGVAATLEGPGSPAACAATLSYRNLPSTYVCQHRFDPPTGDLLIRGTATGRIYGFPARSRLDVHRVIRAEYHRLEDWRVPENGDPTAGWDDTPRALRAIQHGMTHVAWDGARQTLSNMSWNVGQQRYVDDSPHGFHEIAWTAGTVAALPLLRVGLAGGDTTAVEQARMIFDRVAGAVNPASGLFHDAVDRHGNAVQGWWSYYNLTPWEHHAYLVGGAATNLLHAFESDPTAPGRGRWLDATVGVLERVVDMQADDGAFPWCVSRTDGRPLDYDGFASCWYVPALALAHRLTGREDLINAAERAFRRYSRDVADVHCYGTPLDTFRAVDEEGVLAFIRGARLLHEITGGEEYLDGLEHGLEYEYLWRYGFHTRPPSEPLRDAPWTSTGGSLTSVANPVVHPMALMCHGDALYLASRREDPYHRSRAADQREFALRSLALYPDHAGFGQYGLLTEGMCASDGLVIHRHPDGRPWGLWFVQHVWAAGSILEGLTAWKESFQDTWKKQ